MWKQDSANSPPSNTSTSPKASRVKRLKFEIESGVNVVSRIFSSNDEQFNSRKWVLGNLLEYGVAHNDWPLLGPWLDYVNTTQIGALQYPTEFVDYLMTAYMLNLQTVAEIGVFRVGNSHFAAAMFQRANPFCFYTMIDIEDNLIGYDAFDHV